MYSRSSSYKSRNDFIIKNPINSITAVDGQYSGN